MNIVYKVVDMPIKEFTKKFLEAKKVRNAFDFQDKILLETKIPYDLTDCDENLTVLVYNDGDLDWFTVKEVVTDAEPYRDFLAIPFN